MSLLPPPPSLTRCRTCARALASKYHVAAPTSAVTHPLPHLRACTGVARLPLRGALPPRPHARRASFVRSLSLHASVTHHCTPPPLLLFNSTTRRARALGRSDRPTQTPKRHPNPKCPSARPTVAWSRAPATPVWRGHRPIAPVWRGHRPSVERASPHRPSVAFYRPTVAWHCPSGAWPSPSDPQCAVCCVAWKSPQCGILSPHSAAVTRDGLSRKKL